MVTIQELEQRLTSVEKRVSTLENCFTHIERQADTFGDYKNRTEEELSLINEQLDGMIFTIDSVINDQANQADRERAKALKTRLKQNKTRANNAKKKNDG